MVTDEVAAKQALIVLRRTSKQFIRAGGTWPEKREILTPFGGEYAAMVAPVHRRAAIDALCKRIGELTAPKAPAACLGTNEWTAYEPLPEPPASSNVDHPKHYNTNPSGVECIDVVEHMPFNIGNAMKYLWRCDDKGDPIENLEKAIWYCQREIAKRRKPS